MRRQHRGQVDRAGPLGAVEAPDRLLGQRVHIHRFGAVAPARRDGQRRRDALARKLRCAGGSFVDAADGRIRNHAFDRFAVRVLQCTDQLRSGLRHVHRLGFERLPDPLAAPVDRRTDSNLRHHFDHFSPHMFGCRDKSVYSYNRRSNRKINLQFKKNAIICALPFRRRTGQPQIVPWSLKSAGMRSTSPGVPSSTIRSSSSPAARPSSPYGRVTELYRAPKRGSRLQ